MTNEFMLSEARCRIDELTETNVDLMKRLEVQCEAVLAASDRIRNLRAEVKRLTEALDTERLRKIGERVAGDIKTRLYPTLKEKGQPAVPVNSIRELALWVRGSSQHYIELDWNKYPHEAREAVFCWLDIYYPQTAERPLCPYCKNPMVRVPKKDAYICPLSPPCVSEVNGFMLQRLAGNREKNHYRGRCGNAEQNEEAG